MFNVDFFQPYKHVRDSYGVLYLTIINLPRSERFKQQNMLIVGVIPAFEHEPDTLNPFIKPLVDELKEFWDPGVQFYTFKSKLLFRVALMCVAQVVIFQWQENVVDLKDIMLTSYGCSRCQKFFPGGFGKKDFSGFDSSTRLGNKRSRMHHVNVWDANGKSSLDGFQVFERSFSSS